MNREPLTLNQGRPQPAKYKPKRGTLAPLMKEEEKEKAGIHELNMTRTCPSSYLVICPSSYLVIRSSY